MKRTVNVPFKRILPSLLLSLITPLAPGASPETAPPSSADYLDLHEEAIVADLHVDPLLWHRDLSQADKRGQVNLPKLEAGHVDVAIFGVVTAGLPVIGGWKLFTWWHGWPRNARRSRWQAALDQIERLNGLIAASNGKMVLARNAAEVDSAVARGQIAAMIGIEGAHALEGDLSRVRALHRLGALYMGPVHLAGNDLAGASYPIGRRGGLTDAGRQLIREMEQVGMFIDVAHLSEKAFWQVMEQSHGPVLCSHTGVYAVEHSWRNLKDDQLRAISARGGVIGIMLATNFLGGRHLERWVEHVRHAVAVAGVDSVAIGSDMDGFVPLPRGIRDIGDMPILTRALLDAGFNANDTKKILGGNFMNMLRRFRPEGSSEGESAPTPPL